MLADRINAASGDAALLSKSKEVAAGIARDWPGVRGAADAVLAARSPWEKLRRAGVLK